MIRRSTQLTMIAIVVLGLFIGSSRNIKLAHAEQRPVIPPTNPTLLERTEETKSILPWVPKSTRPITSSSMSLRDEVTDNLLVATDNLTRTVNRIFETAQSEPVRISTITVTLESDVSDKPMVWYDAANDWTLDLVVISETHTLTSNSWVFKVPVPSGYDDKKDAFAINNLHVFQSHTGMGLKETTSFSGSIAFGKSTINTEHSVGVAKIDFGTIYRTPDGKNGWQAWRVAHTQDYRLFPWKDGEGITDMSQGISYIPTNPQPIEIYIPIVIK